MQSDIHQTEVMVDSKASRKRRLLGLTWLLGCIAAAVLVMFGPWGSGTSQQPTEQASATQAPSIQPVSSTTHAQPAQGSLSKPIQEIRLGDRVLAHNPEVTDEQRATFKEPDPFFCRAVELTMRKSNGQRLDITLLRTDFWLQLHGAEVGGLIYLELPKMGAEGFAEVLSIRFCPRLQRGEGSLVTGTFAHESDPDNPLLEISVEGSDEPIIGTSNHPFWSEDRQQFVEAGELKQGERVLTADDEIRHITRITRGPPPQAVYNIEVHGEHVYHIGLAGLLVHNDCIDDLGIPRNKKDFTKWFNSQSSHDLAPIMADPIARKFIKRKLLANGGNHEWLKRSQFARLRDWGMTYGDITSFVTSTRKQLFRDPDTGQIIRHIDGGSISSAAHKDLDDIIESSIGFSQFKRKLNNWAVYSGRLPNGQLDLPPSLRQYW